MDDDRIDGKGLERDLAAISHWADPIDVPDHETLDLHQVSASSPDQHGSTWQRVLLVAAAVVLVGAGVLVLTRRGDDRTVVDDPAPATGWQRTAQSPLSPRNEAQGVWTGSEVVVFGGNTQPACPVCDYASYAETLHDGAAYNPATDTWRSIAPLPDEASYVGQAIAVDGDVVYYSLFDPDVTASTQTYRLWHYDVAADVWSELPSPPPTPFAARIVAHGGDVLMYSGSDESASTPEPDQLLDLETATWSTLPDDPFDPSYDRQYVDVEGSLVLFAQSLAWAADSANIPRIMTASFDDATQTWTRLADGEQLTAPFFADGPLAMSPLGGAANGGEVNGWSRYVPNGGSFDLSTNTWQPLPGDVPENAIGAIGVTTSFFGGTSGSVLDVASGTWIAIPTMPAGLDQQFGQTVVAAGHDLFTFGGGTGTVPGRADAVHDESYVWRTGTTTKPSPTTTGGSVTTDPPATTGSTIVEPSGQAALDAALAELGIDPTGAPDGLFVLGDALFCGAEDHGLQGTEDIDEGARQCFTDVIAAGGSALFIWQARTNEGDPVAYVFRIDDGVGVEHIDATRDNFGSGEWEAGETCTMSVTSEGSFPFACTPHGSALQLAPASGCGAAGFYALSPDNTTGLDIYIDLGQMVTTDVDQTYEIPAEGVIVRLKYGASLDESICNDVIQNQRVDLEYEAVEGTLHLTTTAVSGRTPGECGSASGTLEVSGLVFENGAQVADMTITTPNLNCFAG